MCISANPHIPGHCPPGAAVPNTEISFTEDPVFNVVKIVLAPDAKAPEYKTPFAAGADIFTNETHYLEPGETYMFPTGVRVQIADGYEGQVRSRSGLAAKNSILVLNSPGTIDSDYRGEIKVILHNAGKVGVMINAGDRIAQLVVAPVNQVPFKVVEALDETTRGENGFGSTGR